MGFLNPDNTQGSTNRHVRIVGDSPVDIWGLGGRERLVRMLESMDGVTFVTDAAPAPPGAPVVYLRGDYLFHGRLLRAVLELGDDFALYERNSDAVIAARSEGYDAGKFEAGHEAGLPRRVEPDDLVNPYDNGLKKYEPARAWQVRADNRDELEQELFSSSYKGVTDLVTKWVWPVPARRATKVCARLGVSPNQVTGLSLALALLAGAAFWYGNFAAGLALGWFMTFLDTVDGKLARVTLASSRFGDLLDHGLDLVHPPLWYIAWGVGLGADALPVAFTPLVVLILAGYIGGRLCEGVFQWRVAPFEIFLWRPADSLNRLITARRNPNMLILTTGLVAGQPATALVAVVAWHVLSTLFLLARLGLGWKVKRERGALEPWLAGVDTRVADSAARGSRLAMKIFT